MLLVNDFKESKFLFCWSTDFHEVTQSILLWLILSAKDFVHQIMKAY